MAGTIAGIILSLGLHIYLSNSGIDLSVFSESLASFGSGSIIYPILTFETVIRALVTIPFIAVIGAIYPAYKAIKLEPISAIRYI
jgi:ABC-type lipoprotein release transport system permease subunit